jgi:hypothetical protein
MKTLIIVIFLLPIACWGRFTVAPGDSIKPKVINKDSLAIVTAGDKLGSAINNSIINIAFTALSAGLVLIAPAADEDVYNPQTKTSTKDISGRNPFYVGAVVTIVIAEICGIKAIVDIADMARALKNRRY